MTALKGVGAKDLNTRKTRLLEGLHLIENAKKLISEQYTLCISLAIAYTFVPEPNANYSATRVDDYIGYDNAVLVWIYNRHNV